jgi:hypothetical protein
MNTFIVDFLDPDTYTQKEGVVVDQHYEGVTGRWILLLAGKDGRMYSLAHDSLDASISWVNSDVVLVGGEDEDGEEYE